MRVVIDVRLIDSMLFNLDRLIGDLSAAKVGGTIAVFFSVVVYRAFIQNGAGTALVVVGYFLAIAGSVGALLFGLVATMTLSRRDENQPLGKVSYTISDEGLDLQTDARHESFPWSDVTNVQRNERYIWIDARGNATRIIPKSSCSSGEEFTNIWNLLEKAPNPSVR